MPPVVSEELRPLRFIPPSGEELHLRSFDGEDRLSTPFEYQLELRGETEDIQLDFVGAKVTVEMAEITEQNDRIHIRWFNGYITDFSYVGVQGDLAIYRATMRPWLWLLSQKVDIRIFQEMAVDDIIKQIFQEHGFSDFEFNLTESHEPRTYCVQYGESDLDFISRLMEEEGIYYYFEHFETAHDLIIVDSPSGHSPLPVNPTVPYRAREEGFGDDHLNDWAVKKSLVSNEFMNRDYDFEKPSTALEAKRKFDLSHQNSADREVYVYPGGFSENSVGENQLGWLQDQHRSQHERIFSGGNARHLIAGYKFTLEDFPREDQNDEYLIIAVQHSIRSDEMMTGNSGDEESYYCRIEGMPANLQFRSPCVTPRPIVRGPQTAQVVGPKGEEIWCDKYGRVKVQFHWDREGKLDQNSSCWVRVSQVWAGKNWGAIHTPRIGQEVVVSFLEGNPDQPMITGAVYNANNMPPYTLPDNQTQSGIKSRSSKEGNEDNFNEFRFEDKKGEEEVHFQAEKDLNSLVKNKETRKIGATRTTEIGDPELKATDQPKTEQDAETLTVHASKKTEIKGNEVYEIAKDGSKGREVTIHNGDDKLTVKEGEFLHDVKKDFTLTVQEGNVTQTVKQGNVTQEVSMGDVSRTASMGKVEEEALKSIEFKVGATSIKLDAMGVTIKAPKIDISADGMATLKAGGITTIQGSLVKIN